MKRLLLILLFVPALLFAQSRKQRKAAEIQKKADQQIINNLKSNYQNLLNLNSALILAKGESVIEYITNQFKIAGLKPRGNDTYLEQFKIDDGKQINARTFLKVNGTSLTIRKEFIPLSYSAEKSVAGMPVMALREKGVPWFADVKDWLEENTANTSFNVYKIIQKEAMRAALKGATALFIYNSSKIEDSIHFNNKEKTASLPVPVVYITSEGYNKYFTDQSQMLDIELNVAFTDTIRNAANITGYLDNGAASTVIITTPYANIPKPENMDIAEKEKNNIHDITTRTAMLIELARMLATSKAKHNNYFFIAYNGEDWLAQSSKWINNFSTTSPVNYIMHLKKVGSYGEDKKLLIANYGMSTDWIETIKPLSGKTLELSFDSSTLKSPGAFIYPAKIPALDFITAAGDNYTKETINFEGELNITKFIYKVIEATDSKGKLVFAASTENYLPAPNAIEPAAAQN